jgi:hypothetical protein
MQLTRFSWAFFKHQIKSLLPANQSGSSPSMPAMAAPGHPPPAHAQAAPAPTSPMFVPVPVMVRSRPSGCAGRLAITMMIGGAPRGGAWNPL